MSGHLTLQKLCHLPRLNHNEPKVSDIGYSILKSIKRPKQRALMLQRGGALGAYEVGRVKAIVEHIIKEDKGHPLRLGRHTSFLPMFYHF